MNNDLQSRIETIFKSVLVFIVLLILTFYLSIQNHQLQIEEHRNNTLNQVAVVRANLEHEINTTFNLILGMVAYVANNPEVSDKEFKKIAKLVMQKTRSLSENGHRSEGKLF